MLNIYYNIEAPMLARALLFALRNKQSQKVILDF